MAYIAPNSIIKLLRNVPLEKDYINTLYFANATAQATYFNSKTKYTLNAQSYQRANKGVCRVNYKVEDLYDCNYMMFQNTSFGTKWFYAFITSVDYVNNVTADVHYEIDVMQTWAFDMSLTQCFVEREHSATDNIGDNITPEPVDIGEMVFNYYEKIDDDLDEYAIVLCTATFPNESWGGQDIYHVYNGYKMIAFELSSRGINSLNGHLDEFFTQKPDEVLSIYMCPLWALPDDVFDETHAERVLHDLNTNSPSLIRPKFTQSTEQRDKYKVKTTDRLDTYLPRNKKLYTYPYNFFHVDNANGRELNLRFEFFTDINGNRNLSPQLYIHMTPVMPVTCVLRPLNYKGVTAQENCSESIDLTNYPMCTWNVDSYNAWIAQNSVPESISILNKGGDIVSSIGQNSIASLLTQDTITKNYWITASMKDVVSGSMAGLATGSATLSFVCDIMKNHYAASILPNICKGSLNNGNINFSSKKQNFFVGRVSINRYNAHIIDNFFDRFGYATNLVKVPNTHSRPHWNYVKTVGSNVGGSIPADDKKKIDDIFNSGITFWKNASEVDNYSLNNAPT